MLSDIPLNTALAVIGVVVALVIAVLAIKYMRAAYVQVQAETWLEANYKGVIRGAFYHDITPRPWSTFVRNTDQHVLVIGFECGSSNLLGHSIGYALASSFEELTDAAVKRRVLNKLVSSTVDMLKAKKKELRLIDLSMSKVTLIEFSTTELEATATGEKRSFKVDREYMLEHKRLEFVNGKEFIDVDQGNWFLSLYLDFVRAKRLSNG